MKTAIFGGTFDPVHAAHLVVAREAAGAFALDRVLFVPASNPPWKHAHASYQHRFRMLELACAADPRFQPSRLEEDGGTNYTIDTIERFKRHNPGEVFFIIGADAFADIQRWHRWEDLVRETAFIVVARPGHRFHCPPAARVHRLETVALPVSSSEIRQALSRGETPEGVLPEVLAHIRDNHLYEQ
jgi:nicotinate-nucleotide adenylyltransferase